MNNAESSTALASAAMAGAAINSTRGVKSMDVIPRIVEKLVCQQHVWQPCTSVTAVSEVAADKDVASVKVMREEAVHRAEASVAMAASRWSCLQGLSR